MPIVRHTSEGTVMSDAMHCYWQRHDGRP